MDTPWIGMLIRPRRTLESVARNPEAPILALLPAVTGAVLLFALLCGLRNILSLPAILGLALLYGPPLVLITNGLFSWGLRLGGRLLGVRYPDGKLVCALAWSWLPCLYLSPVIALLLAVSDSGAGFIVFIIAMLLPGFMGVWTLPAPEGIGRPRLIALNLLAATLFLLLLAGVGMAVSVLFKDVFSVANVLF